MTAATHTHRHPLAELEHAFDYLDKYQAIDYITDFYVENSQQPMSLMLQDMAECCRSWGGTLV